MADAKKCCFAKADGTACQAAATASSDYCFFHDPAREADRKAAGSKGGKRSRKRPIVLDVDAQDVPLASVPDIVSALAATFNDVRGGRLDPKTGNCLGLLAGQLLKALQESELAAEIEELSKDIRELKQRGNGNPTQESPDAADRAASDAADGDARVVPLAL